MTGLIHIGLYSQVWKDPVDRKIRRLYNFEDPWQGAITKRNLIPCAIRIFFAGLLFLTAGFARADVAIIKTAGVAAHDEARNGFISVCFEANQQFDLKEDLSNRTEIVEAIGAGKFTAIFAIGTQAATLARENFSSIPLIFVFIVLISYIYFLLILIFRQQAFCVWQVLLPFHSPKQTILS